MRTQKRYTSEQQILDAIESTRFLQIKAMKEHEHCLSVAKKRRTNNESTVEDFKWDEAQAVRAAKRAEAYSAKLHSLGEKLSAFRTRLLPNMAHPDEGVV